MSKTQIREINSSSIEEEEAMGPFSFCAEWAIRPSDLSNYLMTFLSPCIEEVYRYSKTRKEEVVVVLPSNGSVCRDVNGTYCVHLCGDMQ